ncbi:MAG: ABC transporter permease [Burkholderiaceae bacterium]|jgi:peptide/nickel transport system permease protein|nr:MAG: ABC transporter permease [Burkholderiaceae bacterium]
MNDESPTLDAASGAGPARRERATLQLFRNALRIRRTVIGLCILCPVVFVALFGAAFAPHDPRAFIGAPFTSGGSASWLGTDTAGRDVLSRVLAGGRTTLLIATASAVLGVALGTFFGLTAALARSWGDGAIMRSLDLLLAFPQYVLVLVTVAIFGASTWLTILLVAVVWTTPVAKVMRSAALGVAQQDFVRYSRSLGASRTKVLFTDILGNVTAPLSVEFGLRLTYSVALVAGLAFLGFGPQPPTPDWGVMVAENQVGLTIQAWATMAPVCCIALLAIGANLVTEGLARAVALGSPES